MGYDSKQDTLAHMDIVWKVFSKLIRNMDYRKTMHDASKLRDPEKACYDKYIPMLKEAKYGSKEYQEIKEKMREEGLNHHFEVNSHHPEHYKNGIDDMDLIDIVEMFVDHFSAAQRSDTSFEDGLKMNAKKYGYSPQLYNIMKNTYDRYLKEYDGTF